MPAKPRLFISHSTEANSADRQLVMDLANSLEEKYAILLDRKSLEPGGYWRSTINFWIETCNAAVILITPESIASPFCQYEWSLLSQRLRRQENFLIVPIYRRRKPADIAGSPHQISEITGYVESDDTETLIAEVAAKLAALPDPNQPGRQQVLHIAEMFKRAITTPEIIDNAANKIDLDLGTWDLSVDQWGYFAAKLMGIGLERAAPALLDLKQYFRGEREGDLKDIIDLVGFCSWVDPGSAERIRDRAKREASGLGAMGLNASKQQTAKCYVLAGSDLAPRNSWPIGFALNVVGTSDADLYARVESALRQALELDSGADAARIKKKVAGLKLLKRPVFVVLEAEGLSTDRIEKLCNSDTFAWVNFLILTGDAGARGLLRDEDLLTPLLPGGFEEKVWETYDNIAENFGFQ